jgi:hypothetical protein
MPIRRDEPSGCLSWYGDVSQFCRGTCRCPRRSGCRDVSAPLVGGTLPTQFRISYQTPDRVDNGFADPTRDSQNGEESGNADSSGCGALESAAAPEQRADLYESILVWLAKAREKGGRQPAERCLGLLGHLALAMQMHAHGRIKQIGKRGAAEMIAHQFQNTAVSERVLQAEEFLEEEEIDSGIVVRRDVSVEFWHLTVQEYLAARSIAGLTETAQTEILFRDDRLYQPEWRETLLLYARILASKQGREKVDALFQLLLDRQGATLAERARCAGLLGAILSDLKPLGYQPSVRAIVNCLRRFCQYSIRGWLTRFLWKHE